MTGNKIILEDLEQIITTPINWNSLSGKTILITGANGFLPAYMLETLLYLIQKKVIEETKILALVRNINKAHIRFKDYLYMQNLKFVVQDVCDPIELSEKIDFIIHAASQASPKYYGIDPVGTLSANTIGTINLLKLAQKQSVESFLYFSSSEIYGIIEETKIPTKERDYGYIDSTDLRACYPESKKMGETICISWLHQYGIPVKIVRPFHTYGPGMSMDDGRVHADFVADIIHNRNIIMNSDGSAKRSFCYLSDATCAFFLVLLNGEKGKVYNVGNPNCELSILELANLLVELFPKKGLTVIKQENAQNNYIKSTVTRSCPDISNINTIGWYPKTEIKEGFYRTIISYE